MVHDDKKIDEIKLKPNPVIVALDTSSPIKALALVSRLKVTGVAFKVGFELFCAGGPRLLERIVRHDVRVFLDLKFHDIPNTVAQAVQVATKAGVWMLNVHASGGSEMMLKAREAAIETADKQKIRRPLVIGVTVLTSLTDLTEVNVSLPVEAQVESLALLAHRAGLDGVVCSAREASRLRQVVPAPFCLVTPGIRPATSDVHDQKRVMTPAEALKAGSDYLVIGRPITESWRPLKTLHSILTDLTPYRGS